MQIIVKKGSFDSMHRVMNEKMKCFNNHGHTYLYELHFGFNITEDIGYAIDFKEIKRIHMQWIDDFLDHGAILNPEDKILIDATKAIGGKLWLMSLNGEDYCNPSVENIAKEIFLAMDIICKNLSTAKNLWIEKIVLYETPNSYTICDKNSISLTDRMYFTNYNLNQIFKYTTDKGEIQYDDRK